MGVSLVMKCIVNTMRLLYLSFIEHQKTIQPALVLLQDGALQFSKVGMPHVSCHPYRTRLAYNTYICSYVACVTEEFNPK